MTVTATVLYPITDDYKFDMHYYLNTHMPLVQSHWEPHGLISYTITENHAHPSTDGRPMYGVVALLTWDSSESIEKGIKEEGAVVFGDIPNFTNVQPVLLVGKVVAAEGKNNLVV